MTKPRVSLIGGGDQNGAGLHYTEYGAKDHHCVVVVDAHGQVTTIDISLKNRRPSER